MEDNKKKLYPEIDSTLYELDSKYKMNFASNDDQNNSDSDDSNNNQDDSSNNKNPLKKNNKSFVTVIIMTLVLGLLIFFIVYFFVIRNNTKNVETYTNADLVFTVDADHDGKVDVDEKGNISLANWTDRNTDHFAINGDKDPKGIVNSANKLAEILIDVEYYEPKVSIIASYARSDVYYISGSYVSKTTNRDGTINKEARNFQATIDSTTKDTYLRIILENATEDNKSIYYDASKKSYSIQTQNTTSSWLVPLIFFIVIFVLGYFLVSRMFKQSGLGNGGNPMGGFVNNVGKRQTGSKIRFSDVAGCDEAKAELVELVDYFHATDKYTRLGAKLPHGVLLVGPPGTGKTLLAKAVAGEANVPFYSVSGSDFVEMYVGVGASRIRSLFKTAKSNAPCLVFIDEIDAVGRQRGAGIGGGNDEREQTLNELLVEMDGFEDNSGVIVIAATNRSDVLDAALTRPGRFDRTVTVDLPDKKGRSEILKVHSRNKKLASDVSFDSIATRTVGFSGADLANIMNEAAILAVRANRNAITMADIDEAIDREIAGPAKKSHLEENEKKQVAYHESGHAVIGLFLPYSDVVQKITIIPRGRTGGHVLMTPEKDHFLLTKNQLIARITGYLGGRTSEEIFFGDVSTGASNDIEVATELARSMVTQYGMSELGPIQYERPGGSVFLGRDYNSTASNYSTQIAFEIDKAVRQIIDECHKKAAELLNEHKDDVELIAKTLIERETITAEEITYLIKNRKMPEVDNHVQAKDGLVPLNKNDIFLYPGYEEFYIAIDKILENNPSKIVLTVASNSRSISVDVFKTACVANCSDPSRIGMLFVDSKQASEISLSIESFAQHLEDYAKVPVLLIRTNEESLQVLKNTFEKKAESKENSPVINEAESISLKNDEKNDSQNDDSVSQESIKADEESSNEENDDSSISDEENDDHKED